MADIRCPMCGKPNPAELEVCQFCGARLKPLLPTSPDNSHPIKAGDQPTQKVTSELDKVKLSEAGSIRPGEAPTKKNTAELEKALPSWLRSLRGGEDSPEAKSQEKTGSSEDLPPLSSGASTPGRFGESSDWLAGFDRVSANEEEAVPDWLAGLRGEKPAEAESAPGQGVEAEPAPELDSTDWMSRLDGNPPAATSEPPAAEAPAASASSDQAPDWLKSLQSFESKPSEPAAPPAGEEKFPEWYSNLPGISAESESEAGPAPSGAAEPAPAEELPDWLNQLQEEKGTNPESTPPAAGTGEPGPGDNVPDWLNQYSDKSIPPESAFGPAGAAEPTSAEKMPDWLNQLQEKSVQPEPAAPGENEALPDWLSNLEPEAETPLAAPGENVPDWLSNLEAKPGSESSNFPAAVEGNVPEGAQPAEEIPSWLSQIQAEKTTAEEGESQVEGSGPVPEWLASIEPAAAPPASEPPAFVVDQEAQPLEKTGEKAFSMEAPDWLAKLKPEQTAEKGAVSEEEQPPAGDLEAASLPTWVQAMRPVESVVDQAKTGPLEEDQITEQSGPLAGLAGVLPAGAGLGMSRKPPAYSVKLQVSTTQQRYISNLERLVAGETKASTISGEHLKSNRLWRWLITAALGLAVILPFLAPQVRFTPPPKLATTDKGASYTLIGALPANAPVLVAFDYEPALSGELEAVAAPLIDQLQSKDARLAVISTSATGPALAERFLKNTLLVNSHQYKNGEQYVNLGYITGGPAGISYFAGQPSAAMPVTLEGVSAWTTPPLEGVSQLSDFAAVLVLTDDAETGRNWIEQSSRYLGKTPMIMVISAQAEPMVQPYFDSGQLKGLVSGMPDAKTYEQSYNRPGLANHYWDSFSLGTLVAETIIAIGAIWSALVAWRFRLHKSREKV